MNKRLETLLDRVSTWPEEAQAELLERAVEIEARQSGVYRLSDDERACVQRGRPGPYQIQAAINAVHSVAPSFDGTDWHAILTLYDQLYALTPTPVVALNRAVALAEVRGPAAGLAAVDELSTPGGGLDGYYLFHAARADLLRRLGRDEEAGAAYDAARALTVAASKRKPATATEISAFSTSGSGMPGASPTPPAALIAARSASRRASAPGAPVKIAAG